MSIRFCLLLGILAAASQTVLADEGFFKISQLAPSQRPQNLERAAASSVHLWPGCSGSFVSNDGYMITAAHCIQSCLEENHVNITENSGKNPDYFVLQISDQHPRGVSCPKMEVKDLGLTNPTIVFVGRGYAYFDDNQVPSYFDSLFEQMISAEDDFAILKFSVKAPVACVPTSTQPVSLNQRIWGIGFPRQATRANGYNSDGVSQYISTGSVYDGVTHDSYYLKAGFNGAHLDRLERFYGSSPHFVSNMDSFPGMSGSMAIDEDGNLVGVNVAGAVPDANLISTTYVDGSSISLRLTTVVQELHEIAGPNTITQIFNCSP